MPQITLFRGSKRRDVFTSMIDVLRHCNGKILTHIMMDANISGNLIGKYLGDLINLGLVEKRGNLYFKTDLGVYAMKSINEIFSLFGGEVSNGRQNSMSRVRT